MILQIILLLLFLFLAVYLSEEKAVLLVLMLLPLHFMFKSAISPWIGQGQLFGVWKEMVVGIVAMKICYQLYKKGYLSINISRYGFRLYCWQGWAFCFYVHPLRLMHLSQ